MVMKSLAEGTVPQNIVTHPHPDDPKLTHVIAFLVHDKKFVLPFNITYLTCGDSYVHELKAIKKLDRQLAFADLLHEIDKVKMKLTSQEYKDICGSLKLAFERSP